jgi:hypothetical protein
VLVTRFARRKNNEMNSACEGGYARNFQVLDDELIVRSCDSVPSRSRTPLEHAGTPGPARATRFASGADLRFGVHHLPASVPVTQHVAMVPLVGIDLLSAKGNRSQARGFNRSLLEVLGRVFARLDQDQPVARVVAQYRLDSVGSLRWWLGEFDSLR